MIQLYLRLTAPAGRAPEILQALEADRLPAQLDRACARTFLGGDHQDLDVVVYHEEWLCEEALRRRVASPSFRRLLGVLELSVVPPAIEFRDVAGVRGLEFIAEVREIGQASDPLGAPASTSQGRRS